MNVPTYGKLKEAALQWRGQEVFADLATAILLGQCWKSYRDKYDALVYALFAVPTGETDDDGNEVVEWSKSASNIALRKTAGLVAVAAGLGPDADGNIPVDRLHAERPTVVGLDKGYRLLKRAEDLPDDDAASIEAKVRECYDAAVKRNGGRGRFDVRMEWAVSQVLPRKTRAPKSDEPTTTTEPTTEPTTDDAPLSAAAVGGEGTVAVVDMGAADLQVLAADLDRQVQVLARDLKVSRLKVATCMLAAIRFCETHDPAAVKRALMFGDREPDESDESAEPTADDK
jgi:hypothetical protein